ncbi:cache domain-containing protein [Kinneretia asaccharophila]|uniref:histidine kinase n=1 Tax=Roseateles asaccharophilus TaxID=582607 RepID=A0A4R6N3P9_9BURK|nr:cache domain-containing protein [Roseateles asaccharophilus]MDN3545554.1 cache domain-containing protein [Roseateles asaccharophilus]TDP07935.1 HAMP domain-containing protein [Roseateles asaccharophilus]
MKQPLSLRTKLLLLSLLPLWAVLPLLGLILVYWGDAAFDRLLITKVRSDLAVAKGYFERVQGEIAGGTRAAASAHRLVHLLQNQRLQDLPALLADARREHQLEFINLLGPEGELRANEFGLVAPQGAPLPELVADNNGNLASVALLQPELLQQIAPALGDRLGIPLLPTPNAAPSERSREERAMVLIARAPIHDAQGRLLGHLLGGVLLNRNLPFIDHLNEIVYPEGALPAGSQGTATLFLEDVRISTNVRLFESSRGERAIGTRVSQQVREQVLGSGGTWLARAFVVKDWYISAYLPLSNKDGQRVGMLYVGFLERPFQWAKYSVLAGVACVFLAVMLLAAWVSLRWAGSIFRPVERMARTMARVESGESDARVGLLPARDELGSLAGHLDHLLDTVDDKTRALQRWGEELDRKVAERSADLEAAQTQLLHSEKLATVGQLTASIAHEINNPIAVIQGNLDLMRELLGPAAEPARAEIRLIDQQIERMRLIVTQLLQYARPGEYAGYVEPVDPGEALDSSLLLVEHLLSRARIQVRRDYRARRSVGINRQELQQVLINLMVNAAQAMPDGGRLSLSTEDWDGPAGAGVRIAVCDTGPGLSPEMMARLFQPFVTSKAEGTGLGLWISRSIVQRYQGELRAEADPEGACFSLLLLSEPTQAA